ncbi:MAG: hypothetical protein HOC09_19455 [Deltaproteobacteria bacterium]|jgi:hypothetical protein|nr:hypothetical protein [Deltaproteobacteria bacterium]
MKTGNRIFAIIISSLLISCSFSSKPKPITEANFLTLADVTGRTTLRENSPDVRVIGVKSKAFIKRNNIRAAKQKALEGAALIAVETMIRELMSAEDYNRQYEEIGRYFSKNIEKYIIDREVNGEKEIYMGKFYGISATFKVSRQKVLVALQKDLRIVDASGSTLVTVITSRKDLDLSAIGFRFSDIEDALMNQIQTDLNQRGLKALDFRNSIASLQSDPKMKAEVAKISRQQFMAMVAGSKAGDTMLDRQLQDAEAFYASGLSILKKLAKVVVEVNIMSVSKTGNSMVLSLNITAKNISVGSGGAFANTIVQVARQAGPNTDDSAMLTALIKDAYEDMNRSFIPQVIKEMSTIDVSGDKLAFYELVMRGYSGRDFRKIRRMIENAQTDNFRFIDFDNTLKDAQPSMNRLFVRYAGKSSKLADIMLDLLESGKLPADEPIIAPGLTDLVFKKIVED